MFLGRSVSVSYMVFIKYCFFSKILKYIPDSVSACVHWTSRLGRQMAGRTPALQQNWQSLEKSQLFKEKNTIFNEHPVRYHVGQGPIS